MAKNYKNLWINSDLDSDGFGNKVQATWDELPEGTWSAAYAPSRVRGDTYTPYKGSDEWTKDANRRMAEESNYNFRVKNNY